MRIPRRWLLALAFGALSACDSGLVGEGQQCDSSEECAAGLVCDFGKSPHTCEPTDSLTRDLAVRVMTDLSMPDLASTLGDP
jgi:hypothetical protein